MTNISPEEAKKRMDEGWTYLDVRSEAEFERGHPEGAFNVPLMHAGPTGMAPNPEFAAVVQAIFPKESRLVVGCMAGVRSAKAIQILEGLGYTQLLNQRAGWGGAKDASGAAELGWHARNLPAETGAPEKRSYQGLVRQSGLDVQHKER